MEIRDFIENIEWYKGEHGVAKHVSASQIGGDLLPIWLSKTAKRDVNNRIGLAYIGSAFHLGMEEALNDKMDERYDTEVVAKRVLPNGWTITGTADVIDTEKENIHDYKTTGNSGYKQKRKDAKDVKSQFSVQGSCLLYVNNFKGQFYGEVFIRDWKPWHKDHPANAYQQLPVDTMCHNQTEVYLVQKTDKLQGYIERDEAPPECDDVMWMVYEGNRIKLKCEYYCDFKNSCPHYKKNTNHLAAKKAKIGGW